MSQKMTAHGNLFQVWAGTDACEPVTWQECKLVPKEVKFIVPEMNCLEKQELWYHMPEQVGMVHGRSRRGNVHIHR